MKTSSFEEKIIYILNKEKVNFIREKKFKELGQKRFDFYLVDLDILIEVDGQYHFTAVRNSRKKFLRHQENDRTKNSFCLRNGIDLYRIPFWEINHVSTLNDLLQEKFKVKSKWHNDELRGDFTINEQTKRRTTKNSKGN